MKTKILPRRLMFVMLQCLVLATSQAQSLYSQAFAYAGTNQTFTVPSGVHQITVKLWGGGGAGGNYVFNDIGGGGGFGTAILNVNPGEQYTIIVGGGGLTGAGPGAYGGGGAKANGAGGRGGGRSALRNALSVELITAGGGGGGGGGNADDLNGKGIARGGAGGGLNGGPSYWTPFNGNPGTQTEGGTGGVWSVDGLPHGSQPGSQFFGGNTIAVENGFNGSGGGGYYGGGSGTDIGDGGGGGGSSYIPVGGNTIAGTDDVPGNTADPDYADNAGYGGTKAAVGNAGRVVILWSTNNNLFYLDTDADGYGDINNSVQDSFQPAGYVADSTDCDDNDATVYPGAPEICDGKDNNCNGSIDEGVLTTYYRDADNDNYGNAGSSIQNCSLPAGYVTNNTDCNDNDASTHPGAIEICDGKDNNCNGLIDDGCSIVAIAPQPASVNEGNKGKISMTFVVSLSAPAITSCSVNYQTVPVTATAGTDYVSVSGTLSFKKGQASKTVVVKINGDINPEADETFNLVLSNPVNLVISQGSATGTIINDDGALLTKQTTYSSYSIPKSIGQQPACSKLIIPTLLQKNQIWNIQGLPPSNTIILFNANGQTVFKADNYKNNNGFSNLTPGVYFYEIILRNKEGRIEACRGKMMIVSY